MAKKDRAGLLGEAVQKSGVDVARKKAKLREKERNKRLLLDSFLRKNEAILPNLDLCSSCLD